KNQALGEARPRPLDHSFSGRALHRNALPNRPCLPQQGKEGRACGGAFSSVPYLQSFSEGLERSGIAATYDLSHRHPGRRRLGDYFDSLSFRIARQNMKNSWHDSLRALMFAVRDVFLQLLAKFLSNSHTFAGRSASLLTNHGYRKSP